MHGLLEQPGHRLHPPDSPEAGLLLSEQGSAPPIVGINGDGVFGTGRKGWRPDLPDACREPFVPLLWVKVHELLGRVPEGSTAGFIKGGTLPGEAQGGATIYRMAS